MNNDRDMNKKLKIDLYIFFILIGDLKGKYIPSTKRQDSLRVGGGDHPSSECISKDPVNH